MTRNTKGIVFVGAAVFAAAFIFMVFSVLPTDNDPRPISTATSPASAPADGTPDQAALVEQGKGLATQLGCTACHSVDGSTVIGPSWKGLAGSQVTLADGTTVTADDAYLRESITDADKQIVQGFTAGVMSASVQLQMPTITSGNNLDALVAYIGSLK